MCCLLLVAVILRVEVHGRADIAMPQHALNRLRIDLPLVHKPGAQAVTQVVKTKPVAPSQEQLRRWSPPVANDPVRMDTYLGVLTNAR